MTKALIMKASIVLGVFLVIIGVSYGVSLITSNDADPTLENPEDIYVTVGDLNITNQQLYDVMKQVDGYNFLLNYVDRIIVDEYLGSNITDEEVEEQKLFEIYNTRDEDKIAEIMENEELNQDYLDLFEQRLITRGYNINNDGDVRDFVELTIAKRKFAENYVLNEDEEGKFGFDNSKFEEYYTENTFGDVCAMQIRFSSTTEANNVFNEFNLVPNYEGGWGLYTGDTPLVDVPKEDLDETNTTVLTDEEVFEYYITLYNYMNPSDEIDPSTTMEEYCENYSEQSALVYDDFSQLSQTTNSMSKYIFETLDIFDEESKNYSLQTQSFGDFQVLVYKLSQEEVTRFIDLSVDEFDAFKEEYISTKLTTTVIGNVIKAVRDAQEFELYDSKLKLTHFYQTGIQFDNNGSDDYVAKIGDTNVTPEDLFTFMEDRVGPYYAMELVKSKLLVEGDLFEELYGDNRDMLENSSDLMKSHREELRKMKTAFSQNAYANYGFSTQNYTWQEFLYVAFSATSEANMIEQLFVIGNLSPRYIFPTIEIDRGEAYMQEQYEEYYDVFATHILIYLDKDWDYAPDDFDEFVDGLSESELSEFNSLKASFEDLINEKLADDMSFDDIVEEYENALIGDTENEYHSFKSYGFIIQTEEISMGQDQSINHNNDQTLDEAFSARLKELYDQFILPVNNETDEFFDDQVTQSSFGIHFIAVTRGNDFERPSAKFNAEDNTDDKYDTSLYNDAAIPSLTQLENYLQVRYAADTDETSTALLLPTNVYSAAEAYFGPIYDAYMSQTGLSIRTLNDMFDQNASFTDNNSEKLTVLQDLLEVLYLINFPETFDAPTVD
jgi:hypothetical protein